MYGDSNVKVGTSEALSSYVGPRGEVNFTSDTKKLFVHDGQTPGGIEVGLTADAIRSVAADDESNTTLGDVLSAAVIQSIIDQEAITDAVVAAEGISKVARQSIGETEIKDGNITTDKFAANTITGDKVAANTLTSFNILGRTIQAGDIATGSLTANEIGANQLTSASGIFGDVSVDVLAAGTITSSNIFLGSSQFHLDGSNNRIEIDDDGGTTRVRLGKLGTGSKDWGLELYKENGDVIVDLAGLGTDVVNSVNIANGAISAQSGHINDLSADDITTGTMTAGTIDASQATVTNLDATEITTGILTVTTGMEIRTGGAQTMVTDTGIIADYVNTGDLDANAVRVKNLDAGEITSGKLSANFIEGGVLHLTSGMEIENDVGTTVISSTGINADTITTGTLSAITIDFQNITRQSLNVLASELDISKLSDINNDLGSITTGSLDAVTITGSTITGNTVQTSTTGDRIVLNSNSLKFYADDDNDGTPEVVAEFMPDPVNQDIDAQGTDAVLQIRGSRDSTMVTFWNDGSSYALSVTNDSPTLAALRVSNIGGGEALDSRGDAIFWGKVVTGYLEDSSNINLDVTGRTLLSANSTSTALNVSNSGTGRGISSNSEIATTDAIVANSASITNTASVGEVNATGSYKFQSNNALYVNGSNELVLAGGNFAQVVLNSNINVHGHIQTRAVTTPPNPPEGESFIYQDSIGNLVYKATYNNTTKTILLADFAAA